MRPTEPKSNRTRCPSLRRKMLPGWGSLRLSPRSCCAPQFSVELFAQGIARTMRQIDGTHRSAPASIEASSEALEDGEIRFDHGRSLRSADLDDSLP
jgi:hypothetical protein